MGGGAPPPGRIGARPSPAASQRYSSLTPRHSALAGPAYDGTSPTAANLDSTDLAYYFCLETTKTGIKLPSGQSTGDIAKFVSFAHAKGAKAIITVGGWDGGM